MIHTYVGSEGPTFGHVIWKSWMSPRQPFGPQSGIQAPLTEPTSIVRNEIVITGHSLLLSTRTTGVLLEDAATHHDPRIVHASLPGLVDEPPLFFWWFVVPKE